MALDSTVRQSGPDAEPQAGPWSGYAALAEKPPPGSLQVKINPDGGVTLHPAEADDEPDDIAGFDENLADRAELQGALTTIAEDILEGIDADIMSRQGFMQNYAEGLDLLGLKIDQRSNTKGQKRNISRVRDTTLLETIVKAQSQARGELLPAAGPAKVQEVPNAGEAEDNVAADFEVDFNLALTKGMPEYVPDLDRGLFSFFYGGNMFRMGNICPLRGRPMVSTVSTDDLIVSEEATDLDTATRVTHVIPKMAPSEVRRRQYYKIWRQCDLSGTMPDANPVQQKKAEIAGIQAQATRQKDQPYTIYSTITDIDLAMHGLKEKGAPVGLPIPYRVTIEKYSRQILRIERYWKNGDKRFARKRRIIHYSMVPGFGFLAYGFLHLQGNQVKALTAILRLMIDAMMFSIFPGGIKAKGSRTETNEIEPGPGEWVDIGIPGGIDDIRKVIMAMPYKDLSPVALELYSAVQQAATRVGAAAMMEVGEGRANVPVGTIMAMLEEKAVVMSAIHKRMHAAMSQELSMIRELFAERPETLAEVCPNPKRQWQVAAEFSDLNLVPASDPNVPSQVHRIMLATALATLLSMPAAAPMLDVVDILKRILRMIGISDVDNIVHPPAPPQQGADPTAAAAQATLQAKQMDLQAKQQENQRKAATEAVKTEQDDRAIAADMQNDAAERVSKEKIAAIREETARMSLAAQQAKAEATLHHEVLKTGLEHTRAATQQDQQARDAEADRQSRTFGGNGL